MNNAEKIEPVSTQMEQWSILSNMLNYIGHDKLPQNFHNLGNSMVNSGIDKEDVIEVDFGSTSDVLREEYLDVYEGIHSEIVNNARFDENSDLSTTYLGRSDRSKNDKLKAEVFSHMRTLVYTRKVVRWKKMPITFGYRCKQIIYVKIILHVL